MKVRDVMTHDVCVVRPDHTVEEAARMMAAIDVGLLPVGEGDRLVGMITDRDIAVRAVGEGKGPATLVEQVMTQDVKYCYEDEDTGHIARNMAEQQVRRLPVLNHDKRLVGIVTLGDLAIETGDEQLAGHALGGISEPSPHAL